MAKFAFAGMDDIMSQLGRLGDEADGVLDRMIFAGAECMKQAWKEVADERGHRDTGAMIESIGFSRTPRRDGDSISIDVWPQGKDAFGTRNAEKAYILHYGTSKIKADNWVDEAEARGEVTGQAAMEAIWNEFITKE